MKLASVAYIVCLAQFVWAQWNPYAGVVNSLTQGATLITSSGGSAALAVDGDNNTAWQSGNPNAALPLGYLARQDLNILYGVGSTSRFHASASANSLKTTDGDLGSFSTISIAGSNAWASYDFISPIELRTLTVKCGVPASIRIYAYRSAIDSVLIATLTTGDNFATKKFSPLLNSVIKIKLICNARFSLFELGAMAAFPTEYLIVDLLQSREVGYIQTRFWSDSSAVAGAIYLSSNGSSWTLADTLNPYAFKTVIVRPPVPVQARYVKIELSLVERDYAKCSVWEVRVYDRHGPYGKFPAPQPQTLAVKDILGVNGLWGWGHNMFSNSIPQGQGPTRFSTFSSHGRNYHNMYWDVDDPDDIPDYANQPFGLAQWWLDWDREYAAWNAAGLKVQASIQFSEWTPPTRMANWDNPYLAAYNYGFAFARHFGPTYGNGLVDVMEVGNEPWTYPASFYLEVLRGMLAGANAGDPALKLLPCALQAGDPSTEDALGGNWLGARLTPTEAPLIDGINVHHYSFTYNQAGTRIAVEPEHPESDMRGVVNDINFRNANLPGKKIYLSEWGWDSDGAGEGCTFGECVSENEQALYAVRGAMMFMRLGIDRITWYFYGNQASGHLFSRSGLEGQPPGYTPKKALYSFQSFVHLLGGSYFLDTLREDNSAWIYLFGDSAGNPTHIVAWRPIKGDDNSSMQISLNTTLRPDSAWMITGLTATGEQAALPAYASGVMDLVVSSAPLVIKVTPSNWINNNIFWTGSVSSDWNNPLNWNTYSVPTANSIVTISGNRPHYPAVYPGDIEISILVLNAGGQMNLVPGADLTVRSSVIINGGVLNVSSVAGFSPLMYVGGNFVKNSGAFIAGAGKVILNGIAPQNNNGMLTFNDLEIDNNSTVTLYNPVSVKGVVSVKTGSTLVTNNMLTIESGGSLMHGQDTPGGRGGNVVGNVAIKRTGSSQLQVFNYWSSPAGNINVSALGNNQRYYYDPSSALDTTVPGLEKGWMVASSGVMQPGTGYISDGSGTVTFKGIPNSGPDANPVLTIIEKNHDVSNNVPWNLIGNPFPSAIDAQKFVNVNGPGGTGVITGALYFWDDDGSRGSGWISAQDYAVWNSAGLVAGPNSGMLFNGNIASCQSFFVEKIGDGVATVNFNNTMRTTSNNAFFRMAPLNRLWVSLINPDSSYNETLIAFLDDATDSIDIKYDAKKINGNPEISFYSILCGRNYAIQSLAPLEREKVVPLGFKTGKPGVHILSLKNIEGLDETVPVTLEDKMTGTFTRLRLNPIYAFTSPAGEYNNRFTLHFDLPVEVISIPQECDGTPGNIEIVHNGNWIWNFNLSNSNGSVRAGSLSAGSADITVPAGFYSLVLTDAYGYHVLRNIEVRAKQPVDANMRVVYSRKLIQPGDDVVFIDESLGADYNEWDFGDGYLISDVVQPSHSYSYPGVFDVKLRSWNDDCEASVEKQVSVGASIMRFLQGNFKSSGLNEETDDLRIYGSDESIMIEFWFREKTDAQLYLYDVAGKLLRSQTLVTDDIQKVSVPGLAGAVYFVKVVTSKKTFSSKVLLGAR